MFTQTRVLSKSQTSDVLPRLNKFLSQKLNEILPHQIVASVTRQSVIENRCKKFLIQVTAIVGLLSIGLISAPVTIADQKQGISQRVAALEAKEQIRDTLHLFVNALNSSFLVGETNPLEPFSAMLHPDIVLSATPPPTAADPAPLPLVFVGKNQVVSDYGQGVVAHVRPNLVASSVGIKLIGEDSAEADLRFANSATLPGGCLPGSQGCVRVLLIADVYVSLELDDQRAWWITSIDLVHYIAR